MAISLTTGGGINLNNGTNYWLLSLDLGTTDREESWLQPTVLGAPPVLMGYWDRAAKMSVSLRVGAASAAALRTAIENVRNEFVVQSVNTSQGADNFLTWNDGTASRVIPTYASQIAPVDLSADPVGAPMLWHTTTNFIVPSWTITLWRSPYYVSDAAAKRTPVI